MSVVGLCSSMKSNAFLVIVLLVIPLPLVSFGIPPSLLFPVVLGASAPKGTAEFLTAAAPGRGQQPAAPAPGSADWIARQVDQRDTGRDSRADDAHEAVRPPAAAPASAPLDADRAARGQARAPAIALLIRFTYPNDIRGTGFLVWEHPQGEDERFLYLPSLGRVRRIAGSRGAGELRRQRLHLRGHRRPRVRRLHLRAARRERGAGRRPTATAPSRVPPRVEAQGRRRRVPARRLARPQGQLRRRRTPTSSTGATSSRRPTPSTVSSRSQGIWTVMASTMANDLDKTRTELADREDRYNVGLAEDAFSPPRARERRSGERAARRRPRCGAVPSIRCRASSRASSPLGLRAARQHHPHRQRHHAPGSRRTIRSTATTSGSATSSAAAAR